jgi:phosphoribosyl 1,2-cyclic phosphodiesterase
VTHRGPTLGYRVEADGSSVCYIPDHEPGLGAPLAELDEEWISGLDLARSASLLLHDCQYTDEEYRAHIGWGHSPVSDALVFAHRAQAERLLFFHHDPLHSDDFLDALGHDVIKRVRELGKPADWVELARESCEIALGGVGHAAPATVD